MDDSLDKKINEAEKNLLEPKKYLEQTNQSYDIWSYGYLTGLSDRIYTSSIENKKILELCLDTSSLGQEFQIELAGDLNDEYRLTGEVCSLIHEEMKIHLSRILNREVKSINMEHIEGSPLEALWINFQRKGEHNPCHVHEGIFSFVFYPSIPEEIRHEWKNGKNNAISRGLIQFSAARSNEMIRINPSTGDLFIFESSHRHQVYPFYDSDDVRVSVSGNIIGWEYAE